MDRAIAQERKCDGPGLVRVQCVGLASLHRMFLTGQCNHADYIQGCREARLPPRKPHG